LSIVRRAVASLGPRSVAAELELAKAYERRDWTDLHRERVLSLLEFARTHSPYYQERLHGVECLTDAPTLERSTLQSELERVTCRGEHHSQGWKLNASGGSTGIPVRFFQDRSFQRWSRAMKIVFDEWSGYRPGDPKLVLWNSPRDLEVTSGLRGWLRAWIKNETSLDGRRLDGAAIEMIVRHMQKGPRQVLAFVETMEQVERYLRSQGRRVALPGSIMTSAATLLPETRELLRETFGASVFNRYGCREVSDIACDCEAQQGLHWCPLTHVVEVVREDGTPASPGEEGDVLVTSLTNFATPFIRYRVGDRALAGDSTPCACGRTWPRIGAVTGRTVDYLVRSDGSLGRFNISMLVHRLWIRQFQVVQIEDRSVEIRIVPLVSHAEASATLTREEPEIVRVVQEMLGEPYSVHLQLVQSIEPSPSGKHRPVISHAQRAES
jgi:phenylacetate-CoA ligase